MRPYNIKTARGRAALKSRVDPYWQPLSDGLSLGLYVGRSGKQAWKVRRPAGGSKRWHKATLGPVEAMTYREACDAAQAWADAAKPRAGGPTVADAAKAWVLAKEKDASKYVAEKTKDGWTTYARRVMRWLGPDTRLASVTKEQCEAFRDRGTRSVAAGDRDLATMRAVLNSLGDSYDGPAEWRKAKKRGVGAVDLDRADRGVEQRPALTLAEIQRLIDHCEEPEFATFIKTMFLTLQRPQALRMCDVRDFDPVKGTLRYRRGKNVLKRGTVLEARLFDEAKALLLELSEGRRGHEPLLRGPDGKRWPERFQLERMRAVAAAAGLPDVKTYDIRHAAITFALFELRLDPASVARASDTSLEMIDRHYFKPNTSMGAGPRLQ